MSGRAPAEDALLLFLDLETDGLPGPGHVPEIWEIGWRLFDPRAEATVGELRSTVVRPGTPLPFTPEYLRGLEPRVLEMHTESGLLADMEWFERKRCLTDLDSVIQELLLPELSLLAEDRDVHLAGSGVARFDMPILDVRAPELMRRLHYAPIDVGQVRRFLQLMGSRIPEDSPFSEPVAHRAGPDVEQAIRQYGYIRELLRPLRGDDALLP